jgi:hypothetical protein
MLNYILPPIIIIISVSILIVFLFRKAQNIPLQQLDSPSTEPPQRKKTSIVMSAIGQFGLKVLEKIMQRLKLTSLKFHNTSNNWFHSIHERRQNRVLKQQESVKQQERNAVNYEPAGNQMQKPYAGYVSEEKTIRPLVREAVTHPQSSGIRRKNQLEEALIKRIAVNPRDIEAYERLGDYYLESENYQDSHECFSQVLKLSPAHHKARLRIRRLEMLIK